MTQPDSTQPGAEIAVVEDDRRVVLHYRFSDMERMAKALASSGLFGIKNQQQALALMLVAQAEGRHPASIAGDYHIIQGRPTLRADAMLARFQTAGGVVKWHTLTDEQADATFIHASVPDGVRITWDMARAKQAGLTGNPTWKKYPRAMLRSRCASEGVRACFPGCLGAGHYTPEEIESIDLGEADVVDEAASVAPDDMQRKAVAHILHRLQEEFGDDFRERQGEHQVCALSVLKDLLGKGSVEELEAHDGVVALTAGPLPPDGGPRWSPFELVMTAVKEGKRRPDDVDSVEWAYRLRVEMDERGKVF